MITPTDPRVSYSKHACSAQESRIREATYGHDVQKHASHVMTVAFMPVSMAMAMIMQIRHVRSVMMCSKVRVMPELIARR